MGFFHNKFGIKPFIEADIDGQSGDDESTDYTNDTDNSGETDSTADTGGGDETTDYTDQPDNDQDSNNNAQTDTEQPPEDGGGEDETTDYTNMGGDEEGDTPSDEGGGGETPPSEQESDKPVDDLKQQEEEMYGLSTEKLELRHRELKRQYLEMYDTVINILDRIGSASVQEEDIGVIEYVSSTLSNLRTMITDYIDKAYPLNSYIENSVNYNRFLAVLQGVNKILEDMAKRDNK